MALLSEAGHCTSKYRYRSPSNLVHTIHEATEFSSGHMMCLHPTMHLCRPEDGGQVLLHPAQPRPRGQEVPKFPVQHRRLPRGGRGGRQRRLIARPGLGCGPN